MERSFVRMVSGAEIETVAPAFDVAAKKFTLEIRFKAPTYAKVMQGKYFHGSGEAPIVRVKK